MDESSIVVTENVHFSHSHREIFSGLSIRVPRGKIVAIMGPSGSGKTTLLRLIGGQWRPTVGTIKVNGINVPSLNRNDLHQLRRSMGMLFQSNALFTHLSVFDNVAFPIREHTRLPERMIRDVVVMKLEAVGLRGAKDLMPAQLSGGMARRVALARALALDPLLMMYDEPFTGLDPITMAVIVKLIRELNTALGMSSIIVSHDVAEVSRIADYVYLISSGEVIGEGTPNEMLNNRDPRIQQFMQGLPDGAVPFHYPAGDYATELLGDGASL